MIELCRLIWCGLIGLFRSRASLEIEILALHHQLNILRRRSPKKPTLSNIDRLVFAGLYGLAPGVLSALAIVRPETVIRWHPFAVWEPSQRRKKAQDTREPYLATTGGQDERMSSVSSIAGAVNVVLPRGKDDDQNWPPKPQ
jgi:hypothetical protein